MAIWATVAVVALSLASSPVGASTTLIPFSVPLERVGLERIAQRRGVTVFKDQGAKTIKLAAEGRLPGPPERVFAALLDYERQVGKLDRLAESRVLRRSQRSLLVYQRLKLPVISDRDYVLLTSWGRERDTLWIRYRAVTGQGPASRRGIVRVTDHQGSWLLKPIEGGKATLVRYQLSIDMAGSIPRWLVKSSAGKEVPDVFAAFAGIVTASRQ